VVGAEWRSAVKFTRDQRCVTVGQGGHEWSEQSGGVHLNFPESRDVFFFFFFFG
jgi:hypothetical protein